jgi:hypothetical protein
VHSVMQRPSVILLKPLSNKKPIIEKSVARLAFTADRERDIRETHGNTQRMNTSLPNTLAGIHRYEFTWHNSAATCHRAIHKSPMHGPWALKIRKTRINGENRGPHDSFKKGAMPTDAVVIDPSLRPHLYIH